MFFLFIGLVLHHVLGTGTHALANRMGLQTRAPTANPSVRFLFCQLKNEERKRIFHVLFFDRLDSTDGTNESNRRFVETSIDIDCRSSTSVTNIDRSIVNFLFQDEKSKNKCSIWFFVRRAAYPSAPPTTNLMTNPIVQPAAAQTATNVVNRPMTTTGFSFLREEKNKTTFLPFVQVDRSQIPIVM